MGAATSYLTFIKPMHIEMFGQIVEEGKCPAHPRKGLIDADHFNLSPFKCVKQGYGYDKNKTRSRTSTF